MGTQGVPHGNLSQTAAGVSLHATLTLRSIPLVSRPLARVLPDAPAGRLNSREGYNNYVSPGAYELRRFTEPHNTACDKYCSIADQMYGLERALINTGEATPPRKQAAPYTSRCRVLLGSPGLKF